MDFYYRERVLTILPEEDAISVGRSYQATIKNPKTWDAFHFELMSLAQESAGIIFKEAAEVLTHDQRAELLLSLRDKGSICVGSWPLENLSFFQNARKCEEVMSQYGQVNIKIFLQNAWKYCEQPWFQTALAHVIDRQFGDRQQLYHDLANPQKFMLPESVRQRALELLEMRVGASNEYFAYLTANRAQHDLNIESLSKDPTLKVLSAVLIKVGESAVKAQLPDSSHYDVAMLISRNLILRGHAWHSISKTQILDELSKIVSDQKRIAEIPLVKNREVVIIANDELRPDGESRFCTKALLRSIKREAQGLTVHQGLSGLKSIEEYVQSIEQFLKEQEGPCTIIFSGHGSEDTTFWLTKDKYLSQNHLARILQAAGTHSTPENPAIAIVSCCYSQNISRALMQSFKPEQLPIFIGSSEYGQYGYSDFESEFGDKQFESYFGKHSPTVATILASARASKLSKAFLYARGEDNIPRQLV